MHQNAFSSRNQPEHTGELTTLPSLIGGKRGRVTERVKGMVIGGKEREGRKERWKFEPPLRNPA